MKASKCPACRVVNPHLDAVCAKLAETTRMLESILRMYPLEIGIEPLLRTSKSALERAKEEAGASVL